MEPGTRWLSPFEPPECRTARNGCQKADDYKQDILNSMEAAVFEDHGLKVLPVEPLTHRLEKRGSEFYYSLVAPRYRWVTDFMELRGGLLLGMDRVWDGICECYG